MIGMQLTKGAHSRSGTTVDQAAAGIFVRDDDDPMRIEHLSCLGHEPDAAKNNNVAIELLGLPGQLEAIANGVRKLLDLRFLIMVSQKNGAPLFFQIDDLFRNGLSG